VRHPRRGLFVALTITSTFLLGATSAPVGARSSLSPSSEHCTLAIVGVDEHGSYETGPLECEGSRSRSAGFAASSVIATHYEGFNFTGASLSILGGSCNGGWLNLPVAWRNRIASTISGCTTRHYAALGRTGAVNTTFNPGGNLGAVAFDAESVQYG
jgi:hypothetical protein